MRGRIYTVVFSAVAVTAAQDLFEPFEQAWITPRRNVCFAQRRVRIADAVVRHFVPRLR